MYHSLRNRSHYLLLGAIQICALLSVIAFAHTENRPCSARIEDEFVFGSNFKIDIAQLFDASFSSNVTCHRFIHYLREHLTKFTTIDEWWRADEQTRRNKANKLMPYLHYRLSLASTDRPLANDSTEDTIFAQVLRSNLFAVGELFEDDVEEMEDGNRTISCSKRFRRSLQMFAQFTTELESYVDSFNVSTCRLFIRGVKIRLLKLTQLSSSEWLHLRNDTKRRLIGFAFPVMNLHAQKKIAASNSKHTDDDDDNDRTWTMIAKSELFLNDIFAINDTIGGNSTDSNLQREDNGSQGGNGTQSVNGKTASSDPWRVILWIFLFLMVALVLLIGLRMLNIIPSNA